MCRCNHRFAPPTKSRFCCNAPEFKKKEREREAGFACLQAGWVRSGPPPPPPLFFASREPPCEAQLDGEGGSFPPSSLPSPASPATGMVLPASFPPSEHPSSRHSPGRESAPASGCLWGLPFMSRSRRVMLSPRGAGRSAPPHPFQSRRQEKARLKARQAAGRLHHTRPIGTFPLFSLSAERGRRAMR